MVYKKRDVLCAAVGEVYSQQVEGWRLWLGGATS